MDLMNIVYIALTVLLIVIIIILIKYNTLIRLQNKVKKAKANIDIYLNKRFDLIPNIVECVKSYSNYESQTLEDIVDLRNNFMHQKTLNVNESSKMNARLNNYLVLLEAYPELKANSQYISLQKELSRIETELEFARKKYNEDVTKYNTAIESVPSNIVASIFSFKKAVLFQIEDQAKNNINIKL